MKTIRIVQVPSSSKIEIYKLQANEATQVSQIQSKLQPCMPAAKPNDCLLRPRMQRLRQNDPEGGRKTDRRKRLSWREASKLRALVIVDKA